MSNKIKHTCILILVFCLTFMCLAMNNSRMDATSIPAIQDEFEIPIADEILLKDISQTEVMLLGTWHFAYYNQDSHKTAQEDMIDFTTPKRQKEIREVVDLLKKFNPTIVCLESQSQAREDSLFGAFLNGTHRLAIDEGELLGYQVAKEVGLNKVFATDTYSWLREHYESMEHKDLWDDKYYIDTLERDFWSERYYKWYDLVDKFPQKYTINECLQIENHPINLKRSLGHYLIQMNTINDHGPDAFALKWYDRNVRIFNNILKTRPKSNDRILVIYGTGHVPILEQLFDVSPQFKLVRPYQYDSK